MRQFVRWALPLAAIVVATSGCTTAQKQMNPFGAFSARNTDSSTSTPAQLASHQPDAVQPPAGGYQAQFASATRNAPQRRYQAPKCASFG